MDSDSRSSDESSGRGGGDEAGGEESHIRTTGADWSSDRANSDVSEDENFSRGAKSIDSPPESPPRGGGNLDSPPASPAAPGAASPAPYSGSDASETSPRPPESPPSYLGSPTPQVQHPRTPPDYPDNSLFVLPRYGSPVNGPYSYSDLPLSPGDARSSPPDDHSSIGSPGGGHSTSGGESSRSPRCSSSIDGHSTPMSSTDRPISPATCDRNVRTNSARREIRSPSVGHSSREDESRSPSCRRPASPAEEISRIEGRHRERGSPVGGTSNPLSFVDIPIDTKPSVDRISNIGSPKDKNLDRHPDIPSDSESVKQMSRRHSHSGGPSTPTNKPSSPLSPNSPMGGPPSPDGGPNSPSSHNSLSGRSTSAQDRQCSPEFEDSLSQSPSSSSRHRIRSSKMHFVDERDSYPASPDGPSSPVGLEDRGDSPKNKPSTPLRRASRRSPTSPETSDGRSNISSDSSLGGSPEPSATNPAQLRSKSPSPVRQEVVEIKSHGEDLSDVSDIESLGSVSDNEEKVLKGGFSDKDKESNSVLNGGNGGGNLVLGEEAEQLDFEADEREEPDTQLPENTNHQQEAHHTNSGNSNSKDNNQTASVGAMSGSGIGDDEEEGEVKEREDGEISDDGEVRPEETEPRPVCRFFSRGQCTWGSSCRFVHPGVTDKGNYTMFDMVRPLVPMNNGPPPPPHLFPTPIDMYGPRPIERPIVGPGPPPYQQQQPAARREEPPGESAWERGLRQAKELLRRSSKRKETDVDFEEKKMNLGLSGQEEYDKENEYYTRPASPIYEEPVYHERYPNKEEKRYRSVSERFGDYPPPAAYYPPSRGGEGWYEERPSRYHHQSSRHHPSSYQTSSRGGGGNSAQPEEFYERPKRQKYSSREVIVQRSEKAQWKESSPSPRPRGSDRSGRGDEWSDPWMRSKSPSRKASGNAARTTRKKSYSSRSSYTSSSTSRSSSYSSYSRSGSHSRSTRSRSSRSRSRTSFSRKKMSPLSRRANKSPFSRERRGQDSERSMHMNPPAPSPRINNASPTGRRNPTPPDSRSSRNLSARLLAAAMRDRSVSRSSRSSSASDSSASSSDSSSDTASSSSSSRGPSPTPPPQQRLLPLKQGRKKIEIDEKLAQAMKVKAMDALKLSGQKQQIKLTLKGASGLIGKDRLSAPVLSRKRVADSPLHDEDDDDSPAPSKKKPAPSRREELLKQLKAVEDAIARKRSKI